MSTGSDTYSIQFQGETVECDSILDGLAIKAASNILKDPDDSSATSRQLEMIAEVLTRYGLDEAAQELLHLSETRAPFMPSPRSLLSRG
jgi:hypothetical protein